MTTGAQKIVVGYDGSEGARRALVHAAELAGYGSTLTVVSVLSGQNGSSCDGYAVEPREDARQILANRQVVGRYLTPAGDPAGELLEAVRRLDADLLVVGKRNGSRLERLGTVTARVVHEAPCDVLLVE